MEQSQRLSQTDATGNRLQNAGNLNSDGAQEQRRPSIQGGLPDFPQNSPVPVVYSSNQSQLTAQQLSHLQMPQNLQTQLQQFNQQPSSVSNPQNMQQHPQIVTQVVQQNGVPLTSGQQSQSNSLNPSPVSQPAIINTQTGHQQHVLQPILNYQQPHQMQQQGIYAQQPVAMIQTPILYASTTVASQGQAVVAQPAQLTVTANELAASFTAAPPPGSPTEVVKRGRFRIIKGVKSMNNLADATSPEVTTRKEAVDHIPRSEQSTGVDTAATTQTDASITKKKGRFVVKTGAKATDGVPNQEVQYDKVTNQIPDGVGSNNLHISAENVKTKDVDVHALNSTSINEKKSEAQPAATESSHIKPIDPNSVTKKGRFVVKKGGNVARSDTPPPPPQHNDSSSLDGSVSKRSIPTVVSTITNSFPDASTHGHAPPNCNMVAPSPYQTQQQLVFSQPIANPVAAMPISNIVQPAQTVGGYDINGNFVLVSAPIIAPQNLNIQQPIAQPASSIAQSTNPVVHSQQPSLRQPAAANSDTQQQKKPAPIPKAPRPTEGVSTNRPSLGGRIFGTAGVGKVLHHLESVRLECLEADKFLASLQSENRILKDKNKELEAKNGKLERQLAEERAKIRKLTKSLGQNPPPEDNANKSRNAEIGIDQTKSIKDSSPPKLSDTCKSQEERTPPRRSMQFVEDSVLETVDKGKPPPQVIDCNESASIGTASSLPASPRPSMLQETSSHCTSSDIYELPNAESLSQTLSATNGFDPLAPIPNGAVTLAVPVFVAPPPQEIKRFDPLGTPKRSGSKAFPDNAQNVSAFTVPQIDVSNGGMPAVLPFVTETPSMHQPHLAQQQQLMNQQQTQQNNAQINQQQPSDPFDELALRHGGGQVNSK